jgi:hypothetical protein
MCGFEIARRRNIQRKQIWRGKSWQPAHVIHILVCMSKLVAYAHPTMIGYKYEKAYSINIYILDLTLLQR